jgi:hypothetical protein
MHALHVGHGVSIQQPLLHRREGVLGFAEKRADYWRGRYKVRAGTYATVTDATGSDGEVPDPA